MSDNLIQQSTSKTPVINEEERKLRMDLAACYRLVALYGWSDLVFTHISVRLPGPDHHFLINPYGLMFDEVCASNLVKVDMHGNKLDDSPYMVNPAGFTIHSCVHELREDVCCVLHTHSRAGVAVSAQKHGLLPISQQSTFILPSLGYHNYEGVAIRPDEKPRIQASLSSNTFLMLRNHGLLTVGATVADAFLAMYAFETACRIQVDALSAGSKDDLIEVNPKILEGVAAVIKNVTNQQGSQIAWPALLRRLDKIDSSYKN